MRTLPATVLLLLTAATLPLGAPRASGCTSPREACAFFDTYLGAFNRRDWDAFRATLADDITVMFDTPAPPQRRDGRQAVEEFFRRVFPSPGTPTSQLPPPIVPDSLLAQDFGNVVIVSFHIRGPADLARRTVVLHRTAAGWRVVHIHASSSAVPLGASSTM